MRKFELYRRVLPSVGPIIFRNIFVLVNAIILIVVVLLVVFGNGQAGLFLGIVFSLNTLIAITQDIRARILLEKLQMLTALKVVRINKDKTEELIMAEEILRGDLLKLKLGDQMPCEGVLISSDNMEVSEALVTGESDSFPKKIGDKVIAGAIITSGFGIAEAQEIFHQSRLSVIAEDVKKYAASPSSIQRATTNVIKYSGYILLIVILFVISRGVLMHASRLEIVNNIGALASTIVPQGLVVVLTLLFAIGAASYSRKNVLFQEINATEKLGRIKNLCMDKTGTLTDNVLVVEDMHVLKEFRDTDAEALVFSYILGSGDSSQTILAVKKYLESKNDNLNNKKIEVVSALPFSSWRQYGAVEIMGDMGKQAVFVGTPELFLNSISGVEEKKLLQKIVLENARAGKRVLCVAHSSDAELPKDLSNTSLSMVAIFVFKNTFRQGINDAVKFFQNRGVRIRILSGDNPATVCRVAEDVGVNCAGDMVTGEEMAKWSEKDFENQAHKYTIFAQILPEQKVKLIEAFKKDGFTAMVGDGVNDALAMKKADLGIAMFDGVPVTRQLAGVILMTNSFADLPGAVELADHFIRSIEISSGTYINQSFAGLLFFVVISIFGYAFPFTPLNITFMNYFTVGLPGILIAYWALRPMGKILPKNNKSFLGRIMPLVIYCGIIEAIGVSFIYILSLQYIKNSSTLAGLSFILFGFVFLFFAVKTYCGSITKREVFQLLLLVLFELVIIYLAIHISFIIKFFNIML
ncbi:MAG: HAD-IC family P-type ATPase [Patescibacteria group bacterium]